MLSLQTVSPARLDNTNKYGSRDGTHASRASGQMRGSQTLRFLMHNQLSPQALKRCEFVLQL